MIFAEGVLLFVQIPDKDDKRHRLYKTLRIIGLVLLIICIFLAGKRTASVVSIVAPIAVYYFSQTRPEKKLTIILLAILGILIAYFALTFFYDFFANSMGIGRLVASFSGENSFEDVSSGRDWRWEYALQLYNSKPILGTGVNYIENSGNLAVHNFYLQVLAEQGLVGLIVFVTPLFATFISSINVLKTTKKRHEKRSVLFALFCFIAVSLCLITENSDIFMMPIFFIAISMIISGRMSIMRQNLM